MKCILVTCMSALGKPSLVDELTRRGFEAVDLDEPDRSEYDYLAEVTQQRRGVSPLRIG